MTKNRKCCIFTSVLLSQKYDRCLSRTKSIKWRICQAKEDMGLRIGTVWSESLPCALMIAKNPRLFHVWLHWVNAQAHLSPCWVHRPFSLFCHALIHIYTSSTNTCLPKDFWLAETDNMIPSAPRVNIFSTMTLYYQAHAHLMIPFTWADHDKGKVHILSPSPSHDSIPAFPVCHLDGIVSCRKSSI